MEFEEFLKKNRGKIQLSSPAVTLPFNFALGKTIGENSVEIVSIRDLGEWAWKEYRKQTKHFTLYESHFEELATFLNGEYNGLRTVYLEIAVACLGKEEIEKRLKEVKK